jgi:hypothetical protein
VPYPSHIGGRYLLRWIFGVVAGAGWPASGNDQWDDWALFFLGSIVAAQGFTDGNKRLGRTAYGIVLLTGRRPFRAPTVDLENELYAM